MTHALIPHDPYLNTLFDAGLLCDVCEARPWTHQARYCNALICAACAQSEPEPDEQEGL